MSLRRTGENYISMSDRTVKMVHLPPGVTMSHGKDLGELICEIQVSFGAQERNLWCYSCFIHFSG
jgi:hypothetical protein